MFRNIFLRPPHELAFHTWSSSPSDAVHRCQPFPASIEEGSNPKVLSTPKFCQRGIRRKLDRSNQERTKYQHTSWFPLSGHFQSPVAPKILLLLYTHKLQVMDEKQSPTNVPQTEYFDLDLQKKCSLMLERLSNRHQNRLDNSHQSESESSSFESTSCFLSRFSEMKCSIESQLADSQIAPPDQAQLKSYFEKISASISDLEKLVAENSYFLPSYDVRSSLKTILDLKRSLESLNSQLIPKRKFSFKNKAKKESGVPELKEPPLSKCTNASPEKMRLTVRDSPGFRSKVGQVLFEEFRGSEVGEFTISDLGSCEVRLIGCLRALFVHRLKNCQVYVGPVMGSILIEEVEGCIFVMASHQIRIHNAKRSDFYLRVRSRPIIEDSDSVRFSPYCLTYEGIEEDLRHASLDNETGNWANVDDFKWLRATQSPNWSILPENQRIRIVDISGQESKNDNT